jgi:hypothetical protein
MNEAPPTLLSVTDVDLRRLEATMKIIKRGEYKLDGEEILAAAQVITWLSTTHSKIEALLAPALNPSVPAPIDKKKKTKTPGA